MKLYRCNAAHCNSSNTDLVSSLQSDVRLITEDGSYCFSFDLSAGDRVVFLPGDKIPIDVIETGEASLDVVKLTGESVPRHSGPGDEILAGFIVLEGNIVVKTSAVGDDTRVGQITKMIESAPVFDTRVGSCQYCEPFCDAYLGSCGCFVVAQCWKYCAGCVIADV